MTGEFYPNHYPILMKQLLTLLLLLPLAIPLQAQPAINGYVYEMQSGEALEGTWIQLKDRTGLNVGGIQPIYSDDAGYFEFPNLKPQDYRIEIIHVFETSRGPMGVRLFTLREVIPVDTADVHLTVGMSRWTAENFHERIDRSKIYQDKVEVDLKTGRAKLNLPDSTITRLTLAGNRERLMGSRLFVDHKDYNIIDSAQAVSSAAR